MTDEEFELHKKLLIIGKNEKCIDGYANILTTSEINIILIIFQYFGCNDAFIKQIKFDLIFAKYRIFDWLAMCLYGRWANYGESENELNIHKKIILQLSNNYIKCNGNIAEFINTLYKIKLNI